MRIYYSELNVDSFSSLEDIKLSYRQLAKKYHPDINMSGKDKFLKIQTAYEWLEKNHIQKKVDSSFQNNNVFFKYGKYDNFMIFIESENHGKIDRGSLTFTNGYYILPIPVKFRKEKKTVVKIIPSRGLDIDNEINITLAENTNDGALAIANGTQYKLKWI